MSFVSQIGSLEEGAAAGEGAGSVDFAPVTDMLGDLGSNLLAFFSNIVATIPKAVYLLLQSFLCILDVFQWLMRKLAGLDGYYVNGEYQTGDIVSNFLVGIITGEYPIISNAFWAIIILGFILLFLSCIVAIIRTEYTTEKDGNSKGKIVSTAIKSIFYFGIVPIVCIFGVYLANIVLVAVDSATSRSSSTSTILNTNLLQELEVRSQTIGNTTVDTQKTYLAYNFFGIMPNGTLVGTTTTTFSGVVFKAAAYSANRVRLTQNSELYAGTTKYNGFGEMLQKGVATNFNGLFTDDKGGGDQEYIATLVDTAFADCVMFNDNVKDRTLKRPTGYLEENNSDLGNIFSFQVNETHNYANRFNVGLVWYYYDLWHFNFIIAGAAGIMMATIFTNIIFGLFRRVVELIALFIMAPALLGLMPLDNSAAYNSWRGRFINKTMMAYGAIGGMNLIFLILPELQTITFFNIAFLDLVAQTILMIVALMAVKDFIGLVSGFAKGDNAESVGGGISKEVGSQIAKAGVMGLTMAGGVAGLGLKSVAMAGKATAGLAGSARAGHYAKMASSGDANKIAKANAYLDRKNKGRADDEKFASVQDIYDKTMVGSARKDTSSSIGAAGLLAKRAATNVAGETKKTVTPIFKQFESIALDNPFVQGFGGDSKDGIKRMFNALTLYDEKKAKEEKEKKEAREKREKELKEEAEIRRDLKAKGYLD